ncbi:MAG TPA: NfeD family protein [Afifellaceae bacterium]|nr:NfeD family protein [Afifellaceae bacterium]
MMMELFNSLGSWNWIIIGFALLAIEILAPGFFFLWMGIAALIIGTSALLIAWPWQLQIIGFAVLSVAAAYVGKTMMGYADDTPSDDPHLNKRAARLTGKTFVLSEAIEQGSGRVKVDDSIWRVTGPDAPAGTKVRVTGEEGATLVVELA